MDSYLTVSDAVVALRSGEATSVGLTKAAFAAAALLGLFATSANALVFDVTVWTGDPTTSASSTFAAPPVPASTPDAHFTFSFDDTRGRHRADS